MEDPVGRFRAASIAFDVEGMLNETTPDAILVSPVSGRLVFQGTADLRVLLQTIYAAFSSVSWDEPIGDGAVRVLVGHGMVGRFVLGDAMVLELDQAGRIRVMRPHLRTWLSITVFALRIGPTLLRHPGVLRRAMRHRP